MLLLVLYLCISCDNSNPNRIIQEISVDTPSASSVTVSFAVYGNIGKATDNGRAFNQLIEGLKQTNVSFAIDLGNNLPDGTPSEGVEVLRQKIDETRKNIGIPVYPVSGPLDIFDQVSSDTYKRRYGSMWYGFTQGHVRFIVLSTEDGAYRDGFGARPKLGNEQLTWLHDEIRTIPGDMPVVLIMNRPLWDDAPDVWHNRLLPMLGSAKIISVISCSDNGLVDWGTVDNMHAVSSGYTGTNETVGPGCAPHMLLVTIKGNHPTFRVLNSDKSITDGIPVDDTVLKQIQTLKSNLTIPPLQTDPGFNISETIPITLQNTSETPINGLLIFDIAPSTLWDIRPLNLHISLKPGEHETTQVQFNGSAPELGPLPRYQLTLEHNSNPIVDHVSDIILDIPKPRTGEVISINATIPDIVPWEYDGSSLRIPVDINSIDTCGRLIIYREDGPVPVCVYTSPLIDFKLGMYDFQWDGHDLEGNPVTAGDLAYYFILYNKTAPVTWVADGPTQPDGTVYIERDLAGLFAKTHTDSSITAYPLDESLAAPEPKTQFTVGSILDGLTLTGFAYGDENKLYLGTQRGILSTIVRQDQLVIDNRFGDNGYYRFTDIRGRIAGKPVYLNGRLYVCIGSGNGGEPLLLLLDAITGEQISQTKLGSYFGMHEQPPAITVTGRGIYLAHPDERLVIHMTHYGDIVWINDSGNSRIGAVGTDGRSFTYGVGIDQFGFTYVGTPGTSARCGVLGPDGRGLFRVILVQVPGLRVAQTVPMIEGLDTDGLYFVTYGATEPYVFHVPYTIRRGRIVHISDTYRDEGVEE